MPGQQQQYYNFAAGPVSPVNAVETVVATSPRVNSSYPGCTFAIRCRFNLLIGATSTGIVLRIRRDSLTGTALLQEIITLGAAQQTVCYGEVTDTPAGDVAGQVYVATITQTGGTANGSATNIFFGIVVAE